MSVTLLRLYQCAEDFGLVTLPSDHRIRMVESPRIAKAIEGVKVVFGCDASVVYLPRVAASPIRTAERAKDGSFKFHYCLHETWGVEWSRGGLGLRYLYSAAKIDALEPKSDATPETERLAVPSYMIVSHRAFTFTNSDPVPYSGAPSPLLDMHEEPLGCPPELFLRGIPMRLPERREDREALVLTGQIPF